MTCETPKAKAPQRLYSTLTACEKLAVVEDQLIALATGSQKKIVRHGDFWKETHPGNVSWLQQERTRLERLCSAERGDTAGARRAITIGRTGGRCP